MKNLKFTLLMILMLVFSIGVFAQTEKTSQIKFYAPDKAARVKVLGLLEIDHFMPEEDGGIVAQVNQTELKQLKSIAGVRYEVVIDDLKKFNADANRRFAEDLAAGRTAFDQAGRTVAQIIPQPTAFTITPGTFGGYYSYATMNTLMNNLVAAYPTIAQKFTIGNTHEGRAIWVIKISDNVASDENEPEVLFMGLQHAREAISGSSMIFLMQFLCQQYAGGNTKIQQLVNSREIFIIPCFNADGWEYNRTSEGGNAGGDWRKNRRPQAGGQFGVDLNRNWGTDWGNCPVGDASCGSNSPSSDVYYGTAAFSEPETQRVRDWVYTRHFTAMIDQHAFGPYYSLPFGRPSLHTMSTEDANFYTRIPAIMGKYNGMRAGNSPQSVNYEVAGGVKDWMLMGNIGTGTKGKIYGMTGEGGAGGGTPAFGGVANFWPPASQIVRLCQGMVYQDIQLALAAGSYVDIQDQGNMNVSTRFGSFDFQVRRIGATNEPVTVSLIPMENVVAAGAPVTINSISTYYGTVNGSISYALPWTIQNGNGQRLKYIWRVQTGGITYDDTITKFYNPVQLVYDDMENTGAFATNWAITNYGSPATTWGLSTAEAFQGSRSMQESPGGDIYGYSDSLIALRTTQLNLSDATQAYLSFWTKHRAENGRDKLQLHVSLNNGTTWQTAHVTGSHTIQEGTDGDGGKIYGQPALTGIRDIWTRITYDLSPYVGAGRTQVRFRIVFVSDQNNTPFDFRVDDGFSIDNLQVIKSTVPIQILPVNFLDVRGKLLPNRTIEVSWEAETDDKHSYFEVEKAADGSTFKAIGKVTTVGNPYKFIDNSPFSGNNFYRIKQYDKDGNSTYSQVINVNNIYKTGISIYPNPLSEGDVLTIRPDATIRNPVNLRITDAQGRMVYHQFIHDWSSSKEIKINTSSWKPQVYVVKITNTSGEFITIEKIIKK